MLPDEWRIIAVQDAYRLMPWADVLYGCDARWWDAHNGCMDFQGERWSSHDDGKSTSNDKTQVVDDYGVSVVWGEQAEGFSTDPKKIHYGGNSGFQALNLAILFGSPYIVLVGFDMRHVGGKSHFFGDHPRELYQRPEYESFVKAFGDAPEGVQIVNATPDSAVKCYPMMSLEEALENHLLYRDGAERHTGTG